MSGVARIRSVDAAVAYPVAPGAPTAITVRGGMLVEATTGGVQPASAGSTKVLGVAQKDGFNATANAAATATSTSGAGQPFIDVSGPNPSYVTAEKGYFKVEYASNASFGDKLMAAADGTVTKWTSGTDDVDLIVGSCNVVAGVTSGAVAEARIHGNA